MHSKYSEQARALFQEAVVESADDIDAFLDHRSVEDPDLRSRVAGLLDSYRRAGGFLEQTSNFSPSTSPTEGETLGVYRLMRRIGDGGMGVVYLAQRDDASFTQRVAIKVLQPGRDSDDMLRRFGNERQILAGLNHPNIAKLHDGGTSREGLPYLVMEYVEGEPIDRYCATRLNRVKDLLTLFLSLCDAVQFAHRNLVVHRDLKPSNVLVTRSGVVKLLDFGIAKLLNPEISMPDTSVTLSAARMLTPAYASPEQVQGEAISTASDVYSLGVLLYQLLSGQSPYRIENGSPAELLEAICSDPPKPLRAAASAPTRKHDAKDDNRLPRRSLAISRDLEAIVGKALRKVPEQRYSSVALLAEDIRRHLDGLPVRARKKTWAYRTAKFASRCRWQLVAGSMVLLVFAVLGIRLVHENGRVATSLKVAQAERARAQQVTSLLAELFELSDPHRPGDLRAQDILERGAARLAQEIDEAEVRAPLERTIGVAFKNIGLSVKAIPLLQSALTNERAQSGHQSDASLEILHEIAEAYLNSGDLESAEQLYQEELAILRNRHKGADIRIGKILNDLAVVRFSQRRKAEAEELFEESLTVYRALGETSAEMAEALHNLATILTTPAPHRAESLFLDALAMRRDHLRNGHVLIGATLQALARLYVRQGRSSDAFPLAQEAVQNVRRGFLQSDWRISVAETVLGASLAGLARYDEAESILNRALQNLELRLGPAAFETLQAQGHLDKLAKRREERSDAERPL